MKKFKFALALLLLLVLPTISWAWSGKVVGVSDGDTITVLHEDKGEKIRLYGIDTPEKGQDFGKKAKQFTSDQVFGKKVVVSPITTDRYGRTIAIVSVEGDLLNRKLIEAGFAWVYDRYCDRPACKEWKKLEAEAMKEKCGIWSMPDPVPPWEFRHKGESSGTSLKMKEDQAGQPEQAIVYHGNVSSHIFHAPGCRYYDCENCTAWFKSRDEAVKAGYRPCGLCGP